jgi:hypothetical protein
MEAREEKVGRSEKSLSGETSRSSVAIYFSYWRCKTTIRSARSVHVLVEDFSEFLTNFQTPAAKFVRFEVVLFSFFELCSLTAPTYVPLHGGPFFLCLATGSQVFSLKARGHAWLARSWQVIAKGSWTRIACS